MSSNVESGSIIVAENLPTEIPAFSNLAYRPKPLIDIDLQSPLVTIPMYCGGFFFTTTPRDLEPLFRAQAREFTFAVCHFVEELAFPGCRNALLNSNPAAVEEDMAIGIALIDDRIRLDKKAQEIKEVGDEVARTIKCGFPELPSKGKIYFLSYRILYHGTGVEDRQWCLKSRWAEVAKDYFFACVSWGYGIPPDVEARREFEKLQIHQEGVEETIDDEDRDRREGTDVFTSWDANEAEMLGEFVSIDPLVHITGAQFQDSKIYP
jgi:DNA ligase-4